MVSSDLIGITTSDLGFFPSLIKNWKEFAIVDSEVFSLVIDKPSLSLMIKLGVPLVFKNIVTYAELAFELTEKELDSPKES